MNQKNINRIYKPILLAIFLFMLLIINLFCSDGSDPNYEAGISIYRLEDEKIKWNDFLKIGNKDSLKIIEWISSDMIDAYDFSSHVIYLNTDPPSIDPTSLPGVSVVIAGDKKCYYLSNQGISNCPQYCYLGRINPSRVKMLILEFNNYYYSDIRNDERVKLALISSGKYRGGIKITLDDIISKIQNDSPYFEFSLTLTNNDDQNLYLIDPLDNWTNKWWSSGMSYLSFWKKNNYDYSFFNIPTLYAENYPHRTIVIPEQLVPEKLLFIKRKAYISRKYLVPAINIPYGNLRCAFYYSGVMGATQQESNLSDGRVWIGYIYSNIMDVTFSKEIGLVINNKNIVLE